MNKVSALGQKTRGPSHVSPANKLIRRLSDARVQLQNDIHATGEMAALNQMQEMKLMTFYFSPFKDAVRAKEQDDRNQTLFSVKGRVHGFINFTC